MRILKELSRKEFKLEFGTKEKCMKHLSSIKWGESYKCRKCKAGKHIMGKQIGSKRCVKCGYDESPTAHTMFHKLKFGIDKAFEMLYEITTSKKGANSIWLAERFDVAQNTAWLFRQKVQLVMKSSKNNPLEKEVHVDEFEIGTPQEGEQGRSKSDKKIRIVIALEYRDGKCGRGYAKIIKDYSSESLRPIFTYHIKSNALIKADGWSAYKPLKKEFANLTQELSEKGRNFVMLHNQIRNFKNWLRGVHSYCDHKYLQKYIDEYFYRFNRRNHRKTILPKILNRIVDSKPLTLQQIRTLAT